MRQVILGQNDALAMIQSAFSSGRFHHAWIFFGPAGVGKFTTAVEVAKILLDPGASTNLAGELEAVPDGAIVRQVEARSHPDLHIIYKELALYSDNPALRARKLINLPLDLLRERMLGGRTSDDRTHEAAAYRTPALGHRKVFIIDEAELIDQTGQNALLKTLEEPPTETFIFLITNRPQRLLPTILSRCQQVQFNRLDHAAMEQWFAAAKLDADSAAHAWIERFCDGSPGAATLAATFGFHQWQATLQPMIDDLVGGGYPDTMGLTLADMVDGFAEAWVKQHQNASKDAANKAGARHLLHLLGHTARTHLRAAADAGDDPERWCLVTDLLREAEQQLEANVNMKHVFENLVVQWVDGWGVAAAQAPGRG